MKAIDPICGMEVDLEEPAISETFGGEVFFFCCESCREQFLESPEEYADVDRVLAVVPEG